MSEYENKTNEELIELLEAKDEQIRNFEEYEQSCEDLADENQDLQNIIDEYNSALTDREEVSEVAFKAGYNTIKKPMNETRAWLNYKIEARL